MSKIYTLGGTLGEFGRNKTLNNQLFEVIRKTVSPPNSPGEAARRFPEAFGPNNNAATMTNEKLEGIVAKLTPEERQAVMKQLSSSATGGAMVLGGGNDPAQAAKLIGVNRDQLKVLEAINMKLGAAAMVPSVPPKPGGPVVNPIGGGFDGRRS